MFPWCQEIEEKGPYDSELQKDGSLAHQKRPFKKKLDGVGPVDNRPSPDKLHHFVKKKK